jgi:uncharacterized protein (TIGR03083 family)
MSASPPTPAVSERFERSLAALAAESAATEEALRALQADVFGWPTRCPAWDVRGLTGHMLRDVDRMIDCVGQDAPAEADTGAAEYFTRYDPVVDSAEVAARSIERAAAFATTDVLVEAFATTWRSAVDLARQEGPTRLVRVRWGPCLRLDDYLDTRVLEMAVHGLDMADALGTEPWLSRGGGAIVREMLSWLLGTAPPDGWDDIGLADKGTGRAALTQEDIASLGTAADKFPLLA